MRLRVPDNLIVRGDDVRIGGRGMSLGNVNITLGGDLHATKAAGAEPRVTGEIRTIRGFYDFEGRRFDVARDGHVTFNGPDPTDPALDITASRDISGVEATVRVHGTVQKPAIALSSTPPLEEADVLSLIVFNRPINDLGQGERMSLAQTAQSVVGGMVAAPLAESLRNALNVDLLEIQAVSNEGGPGVTVGNQISERVYLQFRQLFGSAATTQVVLDTSFPSTSESRAPSPRAALTARPARRVPTRPESISSGPSSADRALASHEWYAAASRILADAQAGGRGLE